MNIHEIIAASIDYVNPRVDIELIIGGAVTRDKYGNIISESEIVQTKGRIQSLTPQELAELGLSLTDYEYIKVFLSSELTDKHLPQKAFDHLIYDGNKYKIQINEDWKNQGWQGLIAYKIEQV